MSRNPKLAMLDPLIGRWTIHTPMGNGWTQFEWHQSGWFVEQYSDVDGRESMPREVLENLPLPSETITGLDDASGELQMLYGDGRGVLRVYRMSVADGVWRMWRDAPGFNQRFEGRINEDGRTIEAAWEFSRDGTSWQKDFDVTYRRQS